MGPEDLGLFAWFQIIKADLLAAVTELQPVDFAIPSFIALWLVIVAFPLKGTDERDTVAAMVYILFCTAAGVTLVLALPEMHRVGGLSPVAQAASVVSMALVAYGRWMYRKATSEARVVKDVTESNSTQLKGVDTGAK